MVAIARALGIAVIAEGVETAGEYKVLRKMGIRYMQGYLLGRPGFKSLPVPLPVPEALSVDALRNRCEREMNMRPAA